MSSSSEQLKKQLQLQELAEHKQKAAEEEALRVAIEEQECQEEELQIKEEKRIAEEKARKDV